MFVIVRFENRYISECFPDAEYQDKENKFICCLHKSEL